MIDIKETVTKILSSKKYSNFSNQTIERLVLAASKKFSPKQIEHEVKKKLHQISSAFSLNARQILKLENEIATYNGDLKKLLINKILPLHSSTSERVNDLSTFYKTIFAETGIPKTILDIGCGLNPLTLPWMNLPQSSTYIGFDIDNTLVKFVNYILKLFPNLNNYNVFTEDVFNNFQNIKLLKNKKFDLVFLFKLMPVLEMQEKDFTKVLLQNIKTKFFAISFSKFSISGKNVGMHEFYSNYIRSLTLVLGLKLVKTLEFEKESVYILS